MKINLFTKCVLLFFTRATGPMPLGALFPHALSINIYGQGCELFAIWKFYLHYLNNDLMISKIPKMANGMPNIAPIIVKDKTIPTTISTMPIIIPSSIPVRLKRTQVSHQINRNGKVIIFILNPHLTFFMPKYTNIGGKVLQMFTVIAQKISAPADAFCMGIFRG
jgi:hypothetical protein